ncbi:hypothetical protein Nmel_009264 [Mimus melanotis]
MTRMFKAYWQNLILRTAHHFLL